ncbi:glycosyltransferase family 4 protein [Vibrio rhodolitus]|uniref:glycosyltransferase family 4 protein n=1 Tax=Vibrio rhodolitus TaxID=2231649 RepID=UPI000E0B2D7B|nr:glycosyltransferase family 4 protein [Vibrio rhodolitus]
MSKTSCNEIWLIIDSRQFGGIETYVAQLATGLLVHQQPTRVLLITPYQPETPLREKLDQLAIPFQYLAENSSQALSKLISLIRSEKPLALHAHGYKANLLSKCAKLATGVPLISTFHAGETPTGKVKLYDWLDRITAAVANHAIVVSHAIGKKLPSASIYLENFIDTRNIASSGGEQLAFVGRLSPEKAPERFIALASKFPHQSFHLYGTGPLAESLAKEGSSNVQFHGHQKEMNRCWSKISVLVICSHFEGLPMVALEAMARGIVVIATNVGELPQLIRHQENGFIAQNESELATCLDDWLNLPIEQQSLIRQQAAQTIHQHYSQQAIIPKMLKIYGVS